MGALSQLVRVRDWLPEGGGLPELEWRRRHVWIVRLLWAHVVVIPCYGLYRGFSLRHLSLETLVLVGAALAANAPVSRRLRTVVASLGLLSCSGLLVHLSHGLIEMHFHYFVMVAIVSLYQDWTPFITAIAYVLLQHGLFGALDARSVFNHPDALNHPWRWALVHAGFIAAESAALLVNWRLNEALHASEHLARVAAERAQSELSLLGRVSEALTSSLDTEVLVGGLTALVTPALADGCAVQLVGADDGRISSVSNGLASPVPEDVLRSCLRTGQPTTVQPDPGGTEAVCAPILGRAGVLGTLILTFARGRRPADGGDVQMAVELGRRTGLALDNARLYERERSVAGTLQRALLPERLPETPGLDSSARYLAGGPGVDVGGDWYDMIPLSRGRLLLVMGDVVGRGEKAAALMGQLRSALRGHTLVDERPSALLEHLSRMLNESSGQEMATLLCAELDLATGGLLIANAGHPPAALRGVDGAVTWVGTEGGPPLGAVPRARYRDSAATLPAGASLLLYTDGLVEERGSSLDEGFERLVRVLEDAPQDMDALCGHVLAGTVGNGAACDDTALLAVRLLPLGERICFDLSDDLSSLEPLRATLGRWLGGHGATEQQTYEILVATCEAAANAMVHAREPASQRPRVEAFFDGDLHIEVRDHGRWRATQPSEGGRGIHIMEAFMDHVQIERTETGTRVRMRRSLAESALGVKR